MAHPVPGLPQTTAASLLIRTAAIYSLPAPEARSPQIMGSQGLALSRGWRGGCSLLLAVPRGPGVPRVVTESLLFCPRPPRPLLLLVSGEDSRCSPLRILKLITSAKTLSPNKAPSTGCGATSSPHGGDTGNGGPGGAEEGERPSGQGEARGGVREAHGHQPHEGANPREGGGQAPGEAPSRVLPPPLTPAAVRPGFAPRLVLILCTVFTRRIDYLGGHRPSVVYNIQKAQAGFRCRVGGRGWGGGLRTGGCLPRGPRAGRRRRAPRSALTSLKPVTLGVKPSGALPTGTHAEWQRVRASPELIQKQTQNQGSSRVPRRRGKSKRRRPRQSAL